MHTLEVKIIDWGLFLTVTILHPTSFLSFVSTPHIMSPPVTEVNRIKGVFTNTKTHTHGIRWYIQSKSHVCVVPVN